MGQELRVRRGAPRAPGASRGDRHDVAGARHAWPAPDGGAGRHFGLRPGGRPVVLPRPDHARVPRTVRSSEAVLLPERPGGRGRDGDSHERLLAQRGNALRRPQGPGRVELPLARLRPQRAGPGRNRDARVVSARPLAGAGGREGDAPLHGNAPARGRVAARGNPGGRARAFRGRPRGSGRGQRAPRLSARDDAGAGERRHHAARWVFAHAHAAARDRQCRHGRSPPVRSGPRVPLPAARHGRRIRGRAQPGRGRVPRAGRRPGGVGTQPCVHARGAQPARRLPAALRHRGLPRFRSHHSHRMGDPVAARAGASRGGTQYPRRGDRGERRGGSRPG